MNFYKTLGLKNSRIDVADALRGLAVAGIILYHSVEHFNMYDGSIAHAYTLGCDDWMADVLASNHHNPAYKHALYFRHTY